MKSSNKIWMLLALLVGAFALMWTPEYSAAFPPAANPTPTRTPAARTSNDTTFTIYLPIIYKPPAPIYLPLVMRAPSPTFTPTATPIPNPIRNWNFESGHVAWWEDPTNAIITNDLMGKRAYSGSWAAWLGGEFPPPGQDLVHTLAQQVTIPAGATTLSFWYWIDSVEFCGPWDNAWVYWGSTMLAEFILCRANNTGGWVKRSLNISAYAGQTRWLYFIARVDSDTNSNFLVDDVIIGSGVGASAAAPIPWQ